MPRREPLTDTEEELIGHLKLLLYHVRTHDGNGNVSTQFCLGCERKRTDECIVPNVLKALDRIENGEPAEVGP